MEIYRITLKLAKNPNDFVLETSEGDKFLHSDIIVKFGIAVGEFDDKKFRQAENESLNIFAWNDSLKYISSKLKTEKQIKDYLYKHGYKKDIVNSTTQKLIEYGIINDQIYLNSYVRSNPNFSKNKLKQKLMSAGIKKEDIDCGLTEIDESDSCLQNAKKFMKNKVMDSKMREKLVRRLTYLGYSWDSIRNALNSLGEDVDFEE